MNTNSEFDRIVSGWLEGRVVDPPHGSLGAALARVELVPQERHWWQRRWLHRERRNSQGARGGGPWSEGGKRLMLSVASVTTALVAFVLALALVVPGGSVDPAPLPALAVTTWTVAAAGGDFSTIGEAVAAASDGDTVLVEPGDYEEAFTIDKDIVLRGTGAAPQDVVISIPGDAPPPRAAVPTLAPCIDSHEMPAFPPTGIQILGSDATLGNLQIVGPDDGLAVLVRGGTPVLDDVLIKSAGDPRCTDVRAASLYVMDGSQPTVTDTSIGHHVLVDGGSSLRFLGGYLGYPTVVVQGASTLELHDATVWACETPALSVLDDSSVYVHRSVPPSGGK